MALTCACGKCDTSKIIGGAEQLEQIIKCIQNEERKSRDMVWRSRIQNRIDEISLTANNQDLPTDIRMWNMEIKKELENLLKKEVEGKL